MIPVLDDTAAELRLPPTVGQIATARAFVGSIAATTPGLDESRIDDVRLATSEAVANAVTAQRRNGRTDRIVVRCSADGLLLVVEVIDNGGGMTAPGGGPIDVGDLTEGSLGIPLIRALTDQVVFDDAPGGTVVRMAFRLRSVA